MDETGDELELQRSREALEAVSADLHRDHSERQRSDRRAMWALVAAIALGVVDLVGVGLLWANFSNVNRSLTKLDRIESISDQTRQAQTVQECSNASTRLFPDLLDDPAELQKALAWSRECHALNGVKPTTIKLPPT